MRESNRSGSAVVPGLGGDRAEATGRSALWLWAILTAVTAVEVVLTWPQTQRFIAFMYGDPGANLALVVLLRGGARAMVDFAYNYGLLSALAGDLWFRAFGLSAWAFGLFVVLGMLLTTASVARFTAAVRPAASGLALTIVTLQFAVLPMAHFAQVLEPVLISAALAWHARGRRPAALAALTAACAVKPALAYVYGLVLLVMTLRDLAARRATAAEVVRALAPATACAVALAIVLTAIYGPTSLARTILPTSGASTYTVNNVGFFRGSGRLFWDPTGRRIGYYLGTCVGIWFLSTFALILAGAAAGWRWLRGTSAPCDRCRDEVIVACTVFHVVYVCAAWGGPHGWVYYNYVLFLGVAAATAVSRPLARFTWVVVVLALPPLVNAGRAHLIDWRTYSPAAETAGLWSSTQERADWARARSLTQGLRTVVFAHQGGGAATLYPNLAGPVGLMYNKGMALPVEVERKARQIAGVDAVITTNYLKPASDVIDLFPEIRAVLAGFERTDVGEYLVVFRRRPPR